MTDEKSTPKDIDMDKVVQALNLSSPHKDRDKCPNCSSTIIGIDSPGTWRFFFSFIVLPFSLVFLFFNKNRYCLSCGMRFKKIDKC